AEAERAEREQAAGALEAAQPIPQLVLDPAKLPPCAPRLRPGGLRRPEAGRVERLDERPGVDRELLVDGARQLGDGRARRDPNSLVGEEVGELTAAGRSEAARISGQVTPPAQRELREHDRRR